MVMPYETRVPEYQKEKEVKKKKEIEEDSEEEKKEVKDEEEKEEPIARRTRSMSARSVDEILEEEDENKDLEIVKDLKTDCVAAYFYGIQQRECFDKELAVHVVEVPVKDHGKPEVIEAKEAELKNLEAFGTFEEVKDDGQNTIGSRWIITKKAHDGQKKKCKGRIVARGFQEQVKPQSDSPTVLRASVKAFVTVAANKEFEICSMDITGAFLQAEDLEKFMLNLLKI